MNPSTALIILLDNNSKKLTEALNYCKKKNLMPKVLVPTYSFYPEDFKDKATVLRPMDILKIEDIDRVYEDSFAWQKNLFSLEIEKNKQVSDFKIPLSETPKAFAWAHLLSPHIFLQFRFCKLIDQALSNLNPEYISIIDNHAAFPWKRLLLESFLSEKYSHIKALEVNGAGEFLSDSLVEKRNLKRRINNNIFKSGFLWAMKRTVALTQHYFIYRPGSATKTILIKLGLIAPRKQKNPEYSVPNSVPQFVPGKKNILFIFSLHLAPWYYNYAKKRWSLCDEYTEGVLEDLIEKCNPKEYCIHVLYMSSGLKFKGDQKGYSSYHPELVKEYIIGDFQQNRKISAWFLALKIFKQMKVFYRSPALNGFYSYLGTKLNMFGILPLLTLFGRLEVNFMIQKKMWKQIFKLLKPDLVIGGRMEAWPYVVELAQEQKIKTASIRLGMAEEIIPSFLKFNGTELSEYHGCDLTFLWGEKQNEYLHKVVPHLKKETIAFGRSRLDTFIKNKSFVDRNEIRKKLGYKQEDQVFLFGATISTRYGQWSNSTTGSSFFGPKSYEDCIKKFDQLCKSNNQLQILIKPWAGDDVVLIQKMIDKTHNRARFKLEINKESGLHNIHYLKAADVIVSNVSCLFGESVCMDVPVINLAFPEIEYLYGSKRLELYGLISQKVKNVDEMADLMQKFINEPEYANNCLKTAKENIHYIFGEQDGEIASRMTARILELLNPDFKKDQGPTETKVNRKVEHRDTPQLSV